MEEQYLNQMRDYLSVIHDEFEGLYNAENAANFAMDIEYKITSDDQLIIKQARPWVSYVPEQHSISVNQTDIDLKIFPNPAQDYIIIQCADCNLNSLHITNGVGQLIQTIIPSDTNNLNAQLSTWGLPPGIYIVSGILENNIRYSEKFVKK